MNDYNIMLTVKSKVHIYRKIPLTDTDIDTDPDTEMWKSGQKTNNYGCFL